MKKILALMLSVLLVAVVFPVQGADDDLIIKVAINAANAPFEYYEKGELAGFDIDLMNAVGDLIGYDVEYINTEYERLFPFVASGEADCAISAITVTEERDGVVNYTMPYLYADVTPEDNGNTSERTEAYAIAFSESSIEKGKLSIAAGLGSKYTLVYNAIEFLIDNGTIEKLIDKYNLNNSSDGNVKYYTGKDFSEYGQIPAMMSLHENPQMSIASQIAPSSWAEKYVNTAKDTNILLPDKIYHYRRPINREEFCEIVYNYLQVIEYDGVGFGPIHVTDCDNEIVKKLISYGIIEGKEMKSGTFGEGIRPAVISYVVTFAPEDFLTREEAATILDRVINKTTEGLAMTTNYITFDDDSQISDWAQNSVQLVSHLGIMNGVGENSFAPKDTYTVEQAVATIMRIYNSKMREYVQEKADYIAKTEAEADFTFMGAQWGDNWETVRNYRYFSELEYEEEDNGRIKSVYFKNAAWLGADVEVIMQFDTEESKTPGLTNVMVKYSEQDEFLLLEVLEKVYGTRVSEYTDKNGVVVPALNNGWANEKTVEDALNDKEKEQFINWMPDNAGQTRIDALLRNPLVAIIMNESDNVITFKGSSAAVVRYLHTLCK